MNGFNKTEAAVFSCRLRFLRAFLFVSLIKSVWCQNRIELTYKCHFVYYSVLKLHFFMHFCIICLYQIFLFIYSYLALHWLFTFKKDVHFDVAFRDNGFNVPKCFFERTFCIIFIITYTTSCLILQTNVNELVFSRSTTTTRNDCAKSI